MIEGAEWEDIGDGESVALLRLNAVEGIGPVAIGRLLHAFGSALAALDGTCDAWASALGCAACRAARCMNAARAVDVKPQLAATRSIGAKLVAIGDPCYPALLRVIHDPPPLLWCRGELATVDDWALAIVGSRRCSAYGLDQAGRMARGLAQRGHTIVSGGARGIDAEAHRSALRAGGRTVAVLGSGLACPYPPEHRGLFDEIVASGGAILSEHPPTTEPRSAFFPRRNRIIAGMALGVLLIEARSRSGAAITARLAVEDHGREAMALPGRVDSPTSEGSHRAIREGWAALVTSVDDVIQHIRDSGAPATLLDGARAIPPPGGAQRRGAATPFDGPVAPLGPIVAAPQVAADGVVDVTNSRGALSNRVSRGRHVPIALTEEARRIGRVLVECGRTPLSRLFREDGLDSGDSLAQLTLLEVAGLVRRDDEGYWEARESLRAALL
ncbi:MAG: DNA-protecting protein DprA [Phycisphaerae bacterium]|jgi:DNA processing protein|nr:DNA-protecting protein DprA [Phycisphaerae bacterium]